MLSLGSVNWNLTSSNDSSLTALADTKIHDIYDVNDSCLIDRRSRGNLEKTQNNLEDTYSGASKI